ncbi:MAG: mechanosensitive ion channel domain-containing protein [Anderseniella sp.]|jgi:small-conductance mechanosensitive channel|nr:mechanosensitive ion channel domain-containing protein [Anderseniella sp.]
MLTLDELKARSVEYADILVGWATSPQFYAQVGAIAVAVLAARIGAAQLRRRVGFLAEPVADDHKFARWLQFAYSLRDLLFPVLAVLALAVAIEIVQATVGSAWLIRIAQSVGVIAVLYAAINRFITNSLVRTAATYVGIPIATLQVFGWWDDTVAFLDGISLEVGNIRLSLYFLAKAAVFGGLLFWLGRISASAGQRAIRNQKDLDKATKELFAKLFEIVLFIVVFILLLQILGLDLTALTVFGGALGVGLGFGLQQIASNFISGIIILLERSIGVGDYIKLEDGRAGILKELNMRSSTLETFDGKEIMVPNEKFITTAFENWTRDDPRQRYEVDFTVSYDSDVEEVARLVGEAVAAHPDVLSEPEMPDVELRGFGDSGINMAVEFWCKGLDDGMNRFTSDILAVVWKTLKANNISIPFPQREVRVLGEGPRLNIRRKDRDE